MKSMKNQKTQQTTWAGIDVAKKSYDAAIYLPLESDGKPRAVTELPKNTFERTEKSIDAFHNWTYQIRDKAGAPGRQMRIVMEATGRYSQELADWLRREMPFTEPVILNPKIVSDYRKSLYKGNDTDAIAAAALARFGAERQPEETLESPLEYKQLRQALYTPMTCLLKHNPEMRAFRQRLIDKGKTPMQARCAVMRKVLILIRALVVNKTMYQEKFHKI